MSNSKVFIALNECTVFEINNTLSVLFKNVEKQFLEIKKYENDNKVNELLKLQKSLKNDEYKNIQ